MKLTYSELEKVIQGLTESQKKQDVTIYIDELKEFFPVKDNSIAGTEQDCLDIGHFVLII